MVDQFRRNLTPTRVLVAAFVLTVTVSVLRSTPGLEARGEEWEKLRDEAGERMEKAKDNTKEVVEKVENVGEEVKEAVEIDASEVGARVIRGSIRAARRERWED
jgi:DNA-binding protein H-NS